MEQRTIPSAIKAVTLHVSPRDYLSRLWRTICSSALMASVIYFLLARFPQEPGLALASMKLALVVPVGALIYTASHLLLWRLAGMPEGPERHVLSVLSGVSRWARSRA